MAMTPTLSCISTNKRGRPVDFSPSKQNTIKNLKTNETNHYDSDDETNDENTNIDYNTPGGDDDDDDNDDDDDEYYPTDK
jgi:hypothetical protein